VTASVESMMAECGVAPFDHVWTHYSIDGGKSWETVSMPIVGAIANGEIPQQKSGTVVLYYFEGSDGAGSSGTIPNGGAITPYSFVVGELTELYCEDFEADDGGYTHELLDGDDELMADDWQWESRSARAATRRLRSAATTSGATTSAARTRTAIPIEQDEPPHLDPD
jgi:hypothetical protein